MAEDLLCYVTNNTSDSYSPTSYLEHGEEYPLAAQTIAANSGQTLVFSFKKSPLAAHGVTGYVTYTLTDGTVLTFTFNNPHDQEGQAGSSNVYFYAGLTNVPSSGTLYVISCSVNLDGQSLSPTDPPIGTVLTADVTISLNV